MSSSRRSRFERDTCDSSSDCSNDVEYCPKERFSMRTSPSPRRRGNNCHRRRPNRCREDRGCGIGPVAPTQWVPIDCRLPTLTERLASHRLGVNSIGGAYDFAPNPYERLLTSRCRCNLSDYTCRQRLETGLIHQDDCHPDRGQRPAMSVRRRERCRPCGPPPCKTGRC